MYKNLENMKKFSISEIEDIIDNQISKHVIEMENKSWGVVTPIKEEFIKSGELLYRLRKIVSEEYENRI